MNSLVSRSEMIIQKILKLMVTWLSMGQRTVMTEGQFGKLPVSREPVISFE